MSSERWQAEVDSRLARLELQADEAELAYEGLSVRPSAAGSDETDYANLDDWVNGYFCATFSRPLGGEFRWCSQWREHREAVVRLEALWCSWRALRRDPALGMATWLHQFLDPQITMLMAPRGTFAHCSITKHESFTA
ncbi:protein of unknown function [Quadrisphaera granulorum]|uniref:Uncharacterized protein DUF4913 n=1 Tax=Quadrisphaera granulorum TaxID=317664 RepID=A0A316A542_9ACTN|nr:uncharacterized protein DUF4913 [Quadrisphaera granulorum]SZE97481.1 protein of unknown function [Quadrisphaera granulorum]